jgi:hypothetical protein
VAHVRRAAEGAAAGAGAEWFLFNDDKVSRSPAPPLDVGFLYIYRQLPPA